MDFKDASARLKAKKGSETPDTTKGQKKVVDFVESYRIRGKMLGVLLRDARLSAARSIHECAQLLRVSPEDIESWEFGDAVPSLPQLELLAYYLGVPVSHFWGSTTLEAVQGRHVDVQTEYMALRDRMVGALLRQAREETNLSIEELAKEGGVSPDELRAYELGEVPLPFHELNALAGIVRKNVSYFLESSGHFGELLSAREQWKHFSGLREDLREFAANPRNIGFIEIALMLSQMPVDQLRSVGASILEITR